MRLVSKTSGFLLPLALVAIPVVGLSAQQDSYQGQINVTGERLPDRSQMTAGPKIVGIIAARRGDQIQVATEGGGRQTIDVSDTTKVKATGGFLSSSKKL